MSKYGFNPDELVKTKVDLIDKDGFHGVGTADSRSNNNTGINIPEGLYFYANDYHSDNILVVFKRANHPELFDFEHPMALVNSCIYFGDPIDNSNITYDYEMYTPKYVDSREAIGEGFNEHEISSVRLFNDALIDVACNAPFDYNSVEEGTPVHFIGVFIDYSVGNVKLDPIIAQLHSTWRVL